MDSAAFALNSLGIEVHTLTLNLVLPIGISFYTFHGLSYVIDIYKRRIEPERSFIDYSLFVSFFPLLVAGPIERATHLLPQLKQARSFEYSKAVDGLRQILWGMFKKIVVADNCAQYANLIFNNAENYSGSTRVVGAIFFAFQIYCDFSGYSDIALGTARLFGIELLRNFAFPYFSRDIAEFWRRWHISLTTWFRDYVYIPLGGSKGGLSLTIRNTIIIFVVSGFWHGANWTFIIWGLLNALYFLPLLLFKWNRDNIGVVAQGRFFPTVRECLQMAITFGLTTFAWIFFRAVNVKAAFTFISGIVSTSTFTLPQIRPWYVILMIGLFLIVEWVGRVDKYAIENLFITRPRFIRWTFYYSIIGAIYIFSGNEQQFIYFQF
ncbi:MAG: MBOAT family O-acyltransferase [Chryseolinea sp.]